MDRHKIHQVERSGNQLMKFRKQPTYHFLHIFHISFFGKDIFQIYTREGTEGVSSASEGHGEFSAGPMRPGLPGFPTT